MRRQEKLNTGMKTEKIKTVDLSSNISTITLTANGLNRDWQNG